MANNYTESSNILKIPPGTEAKAKGIIDRITKEIESGEDEEAWDDYLSLEVSINEDGVWIRSDESFDPEQAEKITRALIEELEIDEPFICTWAYICDKLRAGEFGGGAFGIKRGHPTQWVDAQTHVTKMLSSLSPFDVSTCSVNFTQSSQQVDDALTKETEQ